LVRFGIKIARKLGISTWLDATPHFPYNPLMHFLLLDTADARGCVAFFSDDKLVASEAHPESEDYSTWLLPAIHRVLQKNGLSLFDLDAYAVCCGPGSFTGLRVGLTTVKAWAEIHPKPIAAVSRLEAFAQLGRKRGLQVSDELTATYINAQRAQVFAAAYAGAAQVEPETVIALSAFVAQLTATHDSRPIRWLTPDPSLLSALPAWSDRQEAGDRLETIESPFADDLGSLAYRKLTAGQVIDPLALDANYVRRSDAEVLWKGNPSAARI